MITRIGVAAGDIWDYLEKNNGEASFGEVMSGLEMDRNIVLMSIGWLAREGHILIEGEPENYILKLNK